MKKPDTPPKLDELSAKFDMEQLLALLASEDGPGNHKYLHWDELRRRPVSKGLSHEAWWLKTKLIRRQLRRQVPLKDCTGDYFHYCLVDPVLESLPQIDAQARGSIGISDLVLSTEHRDRYVVSSLIEEAITSSQLEGAATTRKDAVEMLRSGRKPRDRSEQMILNNFLAMREILKICNEDLTQELVCHLHHIVTRDTLDDPLMAGRIQTPDDERVKVWDDSNNEILHEPPKAQELPERMRLMCNFANERLEQKNYLHPIIRAIVLHFWLAYDHPFEDGNGRTARALFYWAMLKQGYWLFEFISISSLIRKAPVAYARSFLFTESDDNDLTYFIIYQLKIVLRSISELEKYIERKSKEIKSVDGYIRGIEIINHRQKALIAHALKHPHTQYSIESHGRSHKIAYATSRADLLKLADLGILKAFKVGKAFRFRAVDNLEDVLLKLN